ncbi:MAG: hypothetical protein ACE363_12820 [Alphaproteobacteria bacterium]
MSKSPTEPERTLCEDFDIEDPSLSLQFEEVMDGLVAHCPVAHSTVGAGYSVINRYEDVRRCALDWQTFSSADGWQLNPPDGTIPILPEDSDPPYHNNWRRVLNPPFSKPAVRRLDAFARQRAGELIDGLAPRGECEFVADYAALLPGQILFEQILPVPVDDLPELFNDIDIF